MMEEFIDAIKFVVGCVMVFAAIIFYVKPYLAYVVEYWHKATGVSVEVLWLVTVFVMPAVLVVGVCLAASTLED